MVVFYSEEENSDAPLVLYLIPAMKKNLPADLKVDRKAFSVIPLEENDSDERAYWLSKTPYERLDAVETMRQILYGYDPTTARLQRVFEVAQRP